MNKKPAHDLLFEKFVVLECWKKDEISAVYLAHHIYLDKKIVLKTLDVQRVNDPAACERFKREAKFLAQMDHPQVIKVLDFGTFGSFFYISFEHFPAQSLRGRLTAQSLSAEQKISVFYQTALALSAVHRLGIIHRDIKPENILVSDSLHVKLADFGLAQMSGLGRLTEKSDVLGTPGYLSPEQIHGETLTVAGDLFSLGIVGYELAYGKNPFLGPDIGATINNILAKPDAELWNETIVIEPGLQEILAKLLQRNPQKRPLSADAVCKELSAQYSFLQDTGPLPISKQPARKPKRILLLWLLIPLMAGMLYYLRPVPVQLSRVPQSDNTPEKVVVKKAVAKDKIELPQNGLRPVSKDESGEKNTIANNPARLWVFCLPWAEVFIDGKKMDTTPMSDALRLYPGEHKVGLQHPDYPLWRKKVRIEPGSSMTISVRLDSLFGFFQPLIHPWGRVLVDGVSRGVTPFAKPIALEPGLHQIKVQHPQYAEFAESLTINKGDTLRFALDLTRVAPR